jgi:RimJ/RimL family protein N-acetyltransferase
VCGEALIFNYRSIKFNLSLGFKREGLLREQCFDGRIYQNVIRFGLLDFEWNQNCREDL